MKNLKIKFPIKKKTIAEVFFIMQIPIHRALWNPLNRENRSDGKTQEKKFKNRKKSLKKVRTLKDSQIKRGNE